VAPSSVAALQDWASPWSARALPAPLKRFCAAIFAACRASELGKRWSHLEGFPPAAPMLELLIGLVATDLLSWPWQECDWRLCLRFLRGAPSEAGEWTSLHQATLLKSCYTTLAAFCLPLHSSNRVATCRPPKCAGCRHGWSVVAAAWGHARHSWHGRARTHRGGAHRWLRAAAPALATAALTLRVLAGTSCLHLLCARPQCSPDEAAWLRRDKHAGRGAQGMTSALSWRA
jgi:hypothetical protein